MNIHDSELIAGIMEDAGYSRSESTEDAGVILIVSCAVRQHAETRVLGRAAQLSGKKSPNGKIVICSCVAQEHGENLLKRFSGVDLVVGPDMYRRIPELLECNERTSSVEFADDNYEKIKPVRRMFPRAFVTIMRGCNNFCSYCIVPYVRGRERSRKPSLILEEIGSLTEKGFGEITLLGQNVNSYRSGSLSFPELLNKVAGVGFPSWIRFITSHPRDFTEELLGVISENTNICNQIHLPMQSGNDRILKLMKRGYSISEYLDKIVRIREKIPDIVLSTDLIVGFPGETENEFMDSVLLLEKIEYDYAFLFKYSPRENTTASDFCDQISEEERLRRLHFVQKVQTRITKEKSSRLIGKQKTVLITGLSPRGNSQQAARTEGNRMVILEDQEYTPGKFVNVKIRKADGWTHFADPVG